MKISIYSLLLVFLSSVVSASEFYNFKTEDEGELKFDPEDPENVRENFIGAIEDANVTKCQKYVKKYDYLTDIFNSNIFQGLINCFEYNEDLQQCWRIFELIKPSLGNVSQSTSTPLILAICGDGHDLVDALLKIEEVRHSIDAMDEYNRTVLMVAARRGNLYAVKRILELRNESIINAKDLSGKTALHYACEMIPVKNKRCSSALPTVLTGILDKTTELKCEIVTLLIDSGAEVYADGPEYKLNPEDVEVKGILDDSNGKNNIFVKPGSTCVLS